MFNYISWDVICII